MAAYSPGDVVWGPDAYHGDDPHLEGRDERPWLVLNNEAYPGHGSQYICCALTSGTGPPASFIKVEPSHWTKGKMSRTAAIDTETLVTLKHDWITRFSGCIHRDLVQAARKRITEFLR